MDNLILAEYRTLTTLLFLAVFFVVGFCIARYRYRGKILSFSEFFKQGDFFVLEKTVYEGEHYPSVFAFRRVRDFTIFNNIKLGRVYHVSSEGFCFINDKQKYTFEKNIVYKVKEVWRDPGNPAWAPWYFYFEIPDPLPGIKNTSPCFS